MLIVIFLKYSFKGGLMKLKSGLNEKAEKEEKTIAKPVEKKKTAKEKIIDSKTIEKEALR